VNEPILSVRDLRVGYRVGREELFAVDGASFDVPRGSIVGLVGESGCGKTTVVRALTRVMAGNARVAGGSASFDGRDMMALAEREMNALRWRDIAFIPQSAMNSLDPVYRVETQLQEVLRQRGGMTKRQARNRSEELFELVGIEARRLQDYPHQFSGGMRQRVAIALALALNSKLVIADEPVTALDVIVQRQILDTLLELQRHLNLSVIMVTHDISVVAYVCDEVVVMYAGKVAEAGPMHTVLTEPLHPYTMGLCNAFPDLRGAVGDLTPIEGAPPNPLHAPVGCRFAPRCPFAHETCRTEDPELESVSPKHSVACLRADAALELRAEAVKPGIWAAMA